MYNVREYGKKIKYAMGIILGNTYAIEFVKNLAKNYFYMVY